MKIAVCIEKSGGMLFNNRRVSRDSVVQQKLLELVGEASICTNEYSAKLFEDSSKLKISNDFLSVAADEDICFIENVDVPIDEASEVYLFQWNRDYPADFFLELDLSRWKLKSKCDFSGNSHPKITNEVYKNEE